ncbi:Ig kappa chain V19-17 [Sciurus carolinensis]|uniref:Ig kappa chain V19-17 n=1 Tax=Sciurus carolinensis TaxID=30640 RepID=A0AA41T4J4_SCICA|nr:Ig kappa chain V19-17 [Sciurus carolinensis]
MNFLVQFFFLLVMEFQGCRGKITLTQSQETLAASPGDFVSITCRSSMEVGTSVAWYQQRPEQAARLLIFGASARTAGTPSRIWGSGSGFDFSLTIHGVEAEDVGVFYCQQHFSRPLAVTELKQKCPSVLPTQPWCRHLLPAGGQPEVGVEPFLQLRMSSELHFPTWRGRGRWNSV